MTVSTDQTVYQSNDEHGGMFAAVNGALGITLLTADHGPVLGHVVGPVTWLGFGPQLDREPRILGTRALAPSVLLHVPYGTVHEALATCAEAGPAFARLTYRHLKMALKSVSTLLIRRSDRRIAAVLLRIFDGDAGSEWCTTHLPLSQTELGEMCNISRHLVNRTLGEFERARWIDTGYNRVSIRNPDALRAFVSDPD